MKPGAPDVAAGAGAAVDPKLNEVPALGAELKGLEVGVTDGVDGAGAPKVKLEVGGAAAGAPKPPDVPVEPPEPKLNEEAEDGSAVPEPNLAGGSSPLSAADRLAVDRDEELKPVLAPAPKVNVDPLAGAAGLGASGVAPKLKPPKPAEAGAGIGAAEGGGEKRLLAALFSVGAVPEALNPGPPNKGVDAVGGVAVLA